MARTRARRARRGRDTEPTPSSRQPAKSEYPDAGRVPAVLLGAVDGVGLVAGGLLHLTRNMLLTAVSGAAEIGTEALNATMSGTRGVVTATSRMVGDIAGTARSTWDETVALARQSRGAGSAGRGVRRPPVAMAGRSVASPEPVTPVVVAGGALRRAARRPRAVA